MTLAAASEALQGAVAGGLPGCQTPLGRLGQPQDSAPVAVFLASDDSAWVTGELILASGGYR
jgi:NAD(P)-dependent dehydrogenase (short-subunit alcohol dehydrogenase family)